MQIVVNYVYTAEVLHRRKVNAVRRDFLGSVTVEVPEATSAEAPVAMRLRAPLGYDRAPGIPLELRRHRDELHVPLYVEPLGNRFDVKPETHRPKDAAWLAGAARDGWRTGDAHRVPFSVGSHRENGVELRRIEDEPLLREVVKTGAPEVEARIREQAAGMVVVDGVVHWRCPEPAYGIGWTEDDRGTGKLGTPYLHAEFSWPDPESRRRGPDYRADEADRVRDRHGAVRLDPEDAIEVLDPSMVRMDIPQRRLLAVAEKVRTWMADRVARRDVPFFRTYYDLRERLEADAPLVAGGGCAAVGQRADEAHEALHRISEAVAGVLAQVDEIAGDVRREYEEQRDRVAAIGVWERLDVAAIPGR